MSQVSSVNDRTLLSLPFSSNRSNAVLLSGALLGGGLAAGGVWLTHRSVALIPAGALLGTALAWIALRASQTTPSPRDSDKKEELPPTAAQESSASSLSPLTASPPSPAQIGQFQIFDIQEEGRASVVTLLTQWMGLTHSKEWAACSKEYEKRKATGYVMQPLPNWRIERQDRERFEQIWIINELARSGVHPARRIADCRSICDQIARKLNPEHIPMSGEDPWDTLLTSVDSTGIIQAVALYSEANNRLVDLVTHPNNISIPGEEESLDVPTRGAGKSVMLYLFQKSLEGDRPLTLEALPRSVSFYEKCGLKAQSFQRSIEGMNAEMKISPEEIRSQSAT